MADIMRQLCGIGLLFSLFQFPFQSTEHQLVLIFLGHLLET